MVVSFIVVIERPWQLCGGNRVSEGVRNVRWVYRSWTVRLDCWSSRRQGVHTFGCPPRSALARHRKAAEGTLT